jgi:hypothetical protein
MTESPWLEFDLRDDVAETQVASLLSVRRAAACSRRAGTAPVLLDAIAEPGASLALAPRRS